MSGLVSYYVGQCAEEQVETHYRREGYQPLHRRWRGKGGEIDLILRRDDGLIFVEVKAARSHASAARRISPAQIARIYDAASEFVAGEPRGADTDMRFDVALVNRGGAIEICENAFM